MWDLQANHDYVGYLASSVAGDPIPSGAVLGAVTGTSSGLRLEQKYDISPQIGANTTIGFNLTSDASVNDFGSNVSLFSITTLTYNSTSYNVDAGTSMASPHVAGLAAMLMAYNPNYTYQDVVSAIKSGGVALASLSGKTTTGRAINAMGSLAYINAPTGVAAVKQ
jgi:subtilisin family serine protease